MDFSALNDEQRLAVLHPIGTPAAICAGAGSGKTTVLTARIKHLIDDEVSPKRILALTFTNKAANEILERVGMAAEPSHPWIGTIHSLALSAIRRAPKGFGLNEKVTPLDEYDQKEMLKKLIEDRELGDILNPYLLKDKLAYHRARGVGFRVDYTSEVHQKALVAHAGYHAMSNQELEIWLAYEKQKTHDSVVDFDDMIHLFVRRGQTDEKWLHNLQRQFDFVLMDEAQDTNTCHPPGTMIRKLVGMDGIKTVHKEVPIESLKDKDRVVPWERGHGKLVMHGSPITIGERVYNGDMIDITYEGGTLQMTPDHRVYVALNDSDSYAIYLMWREGFGFRVGQCSLGYRRIGCGPYGGFVRRIQEEKADRAWILKIVETKQDSRAWEQITSCLYGIPMTQFEPTNGERHESLIHLVFSETNGNGVECLRAHGRMFDYPLYSKEEGGTKIHKRWCETRATNLIPGLMSLPSPETGKRIVIKSVKRTPYSGIVYSMDVENYHTYVANGVVVKNCQWNMINSILPPGNFNMLCVGDINQSIYGFNGANPGILLNYTKEWRGVQPRLYKLERNHRSVPEIVTLANKVQTFMTDTIPLRMESHRGGKDEHGQILLRHSNTPRDLAESISVEILNKNAKVQYKDIAILVRAGSQVRDIETELVKNRIPYIIRGAMGLLQAEEVKDILSYLKIASNPHDFSAMRRSSMVPKRGVGDAALDKVLLNANLKHEGNLVESLRGSQLQKLGGYLNIVDELMKRSHDPSDAIDYLVRAIGYETYLKKKYEKHKDKIEQKLNNIVRLKEMINALMAEREMTIDDVVFQLTMQDQKDIGGEGKIIISTIHAAKGLEWKTVYVVGLYDGSLPHKFCTSDEEISEERRLFYVACTRAKDTLVLGVPAAIEFAYKEPQWVAPSRFLTELGVCK